MKKGFPRNDPGSGSCFQNSGETVCTHSKRGGDPIPGR